MSYVDLGKLDNVIGSKVDTETVTIDFSDLKSLVTTVELPANVVREIAQAVNDPRNDAHALEIAMPNGTSIEFDASALSGKTNQASGRDITISIEYREGRNMTRDQQAVVGDRDAYDINVTSRGQNISDMGGKVTIHAPYRLKRGEDPRGIVVHYVDNWGNKERCETTYDQKTQRVNWKTDHLSLYMIDYNEELAKNCDGLYGCPSYFLTDVDTSQWYHLAVDYALENGLMSAYENGKFGVDYAVSRAMLAQILHNLEGKPQVYANFFQDVKDMPGMHRQSSGRSSTVWHRAMRASSILMLLSPGNSLPPCCGITPGSLWRLKLPRC